MRYFVEDKKADKHVKDNLGVSDANHFTFIGCMRNTLSTTNCANREVVAVLDRLHMILLLLRNFKLQHPVFFFVQKHYLDQKPMHEKYSCYLKLCQ